MKYYCSIAKKILALVLGAAWILSVALGQEMEQSFHNPPDEAKPWVFWFWINGNISKEGITKDLEAMKEVGINGVLWMEVSGSQWAPKGSIQGGSPEWSDAMQWAISEADRLGMEFDLSVSFGYGAGGPWIPPDKSMQKLVWTETTVEGGKPVALSLAKPKLGKSPEAGDSYQEIAVLAVKASDPKNARIPDRDLAAYDGRGWETNPPPLGGKKMPDPVSREDIIDLTGKMAKDGKLEWFAPAGKWEVIRLGHASNLKETRPCPDAVVGLECDRLNPHGMGAHFENHLKPILDAAGDKAGRTLKYIHIDSWEAKGQNWGKGFADEFKKRRGYDIQPWLPVLTGIPVENAEMTSRFLWDMRLTVSALMLENYIGQLKELSAPYGVQFSSESYGRFCVDNLSYGGRAELPVAEFWTNKNFIRDRKEAAPDRYGEFKDPAMMNGNCYDTMKGMASVANTYGRARVGAEAFTGDRGWIDHPWLLKGMGDEAFAMGINHYIYHLSAHQPYDDMVPGLTHRKWSQHINRHQTWWKFSKPYFDYVARCQTLLRQGRTVVDFACLYQEGAPLNVMDQVKFNCPQGFDYDLCSAEIIQRMEYKDGRIHLPSGVSYRYLVLPQDGRLTLETAQKIDALHKAGAAIIRQSDILGTPGLQGYPEADEAVETMAKKWPLLPREGWQAVLAKDKLDADFEGGDLHWIHRRSGGDDIYFVANSKYQPLKRRCTFRVAGKTAELWDPITGKIFAFPNAQEADGRTVTDLEFDPAQSWFVVFRDKPSASVSKDDPFPAWETVQEIGGVWTLSFDPKWGTDKTLSLKSLSSWSEDSDPLVKYYSGTGTYRATFDFPKTGTKSSIYLDLGQVEVIARVKVNGKDCGIAWKPPYRVDITGALKAGSNDLVVEVANTWVNRLIGDEQLPLDSEWKNWETLLEWPDWFKEKTKRPSGRYTFTSVRHYNKDAPLQPSGLLGPVQIQRSER